MGYFMGNEEKEQIIGFIDEMRSRGAVEVTMGNITVKFEAKKPLTAAVEVDRRAQKVDDEYAREMKYWNQGLGELNEY